LQVAVYLGVIILVEYKLEVLVVDDLFYFADVVFKVNALELEAEFEILVIECPYAGLGILLKYFDDSSWVDQIVLEEGG
jgi:hypothetical protein